MINEGFPSTSAPLMPSQTGGFWDELCVIQGELRPRTSFRNLGRLARLASGLLKADISCKSDQLTRVLAGPYARVGSPNVVAVAR